MHGRWVDTFPSEHEVIDPHLLTFKYSCEASDFVQYWEQLFYERFEEMPEVTGLMNDLDINA